MSDSVDATFYVQVEPEFSTYTTDGQHRVIRAKAARITQSRPAKPVPNTVLVKLTLRLPKTAFQALQPEAVVVIPASFVDVTPEVIVSDANETVTY